MALFRLLGLLSLTGLISAQQQHRAVAELLAAQSTVTVSGWMRGHPVDKLAKYSVETAGARTYTFGGFCALATTDFQASDLSFKRTAVFVLPATASMRLASATTLPAGEIRQMQTYMEQVRQFQQRGGGAATPDAEAITPFLIRWVRHSRALPPAARAAGLYAADILLEFMPLYVAPDNGLAATDELLQEKSLSMRQKLNAAGAHFTWDHLGGAYSYDREWIQEAFRIAPDSAAGQQALSPEPILSPLLLLRRSG